ncbi:MAG TPA: pyruvate, phosphate dikinase, partial [Candidatus Limnocylindria bacterium]|nr:pyruvate, phosphate dikinase [Candidatus Limnocylindria bacterium]
MHASSSRYVFAFDDPPAADADARLRLLGGKGAGLVTMSTDLGLPVPPGFTITTEACREYLAGRWPESLDAEVRSAMLRLGDQVGRRFGDPDDPLLVSVRSGAPVSMPGMMDTILNLGLTADGVRGLAAATGDERFAADCLLRLRDGYRAVIGADEPPDDPWEQLREAIEAVFRSWNSERARAYRRREGIDESLGTAVTVQAMVFGNRGTDSGTGVLFTRDPSTGVAEPYGDVMFDAQGEDVVAGAHEPQPIAALDERLPAVAEELRRHAARLERHVADLCDIEFTIEQGRLWMLQVRAGKRSPRAALRMAIEMASDPEFPLTREDAVRRVLRHLADPPRVFVGAGDRPTPLTTGLPASPGVASGEIAVSSSEAEAAAADGRPVILVRAETSPEDVPGMARSVGVLTTRGGLASHAAVVARGWGIPAVVGASEVRIGDGVVRVGDVELGAGARLTIDGSTGEVHAGDLEGSWEVAPEAATLLAWAQELGIEVPASPVEDGAPVSPAKQVELGPTDLTADEVLRVAMIKGGGSVDQLAEALLVESDAGRPLVDELIRNGAAEDAGAAIRLTSSGKLAALDAFARDRAQFGERRADEALAGFHDFDARMKEIVTGWQVREIDGEQALNDHTDPAYDAEILDQLARLH